MDYKAMSQSHAPHDGERIVFDDNCPTCVARADGGLHGLSYLDDTNLRRLADFASGDLEGAASWADLRAIETLRLAGRLVFRSGLDERVAR